MYFSGLGFLSGYLGTRLFLSSLIGQADREMRSRVPKSLKAQVDSSLAAPTANPLRSEAPTTSASVDRAAEKIIEFAPLSKLTKIDDVIALAQSQLALGHFTEAAEAYQKAAAIDPNSIRARLGLGVAYYSLTSKPIQSALSELLAAEALVSPETDAVTKEAIYENLAAAYLYTEPPGGFQIALEYANKALAVQTDAPATVHFYIAAAHGQEYAWRASHGASEAELHQSRTDALNAASAAVAKDPLMRERLWELAEHPEGDDNDLVSFARDSEFLAIVGQTPPAGAP